jgi:hypothetical protein
VTVYYEGREGQVDTNLRDSFSAALEELSGQEAALESSAREANARLSGLKDLDVLLRLARIKISLCLLMMERISGADVTGEDLPSQVRRRAYDAFAIIEGLMGENISEDQKGQIQKDPMFPPLKEALQQFIVRGGAGFLEAEETDDRRRELLSRGLVASMRKYSQDADLYEPMELEKYPSAIRWFIRTFLPMYAGEHPDLPPYGIEEGEEETVTSQKMKMPISQAIYYMENEVLPKLNAELEKLPGDRELQKEIERTKRKIEEYKKLRFFPRSVPVLLEQNFWTDGLTSYTADGEMLVPIPLSVTQRSGTNLDRKMELVRMDLVRRLAGKGVSPELDKEYTRLKSLRSGTRGSSRTASLKMDPVWGFGVLKSEFPALARLEDKEGFKELENLASKGSARSSSKRVAALLQGEAGRTASLPSSIITETSRSDPSSPDR